RRAEAIHAPRPPGTQNRRPGLATTHGGRARHDQLIRATRLHFLNLKFTRWHMVSVPTRRMAGWRAGTCASTLERGPSPWPRNHIVPQQIKLRVAIRYRAGWTIGKFGTVKRNRAD